MKDAYTITVYILEGYSPSFTHQVHRFFSHTVAEAHKKLDSVTLTSQIVNHLMVDTTEVSKTVTLPVYLQL